MSRKNRHKNHHSHPPAALPTAKVVQLAPDPSVDELEAKATQEGLSIPPSSPDTTHAPTDASGEAVPSLRSRLQALIDAYSREKSAVEDHELQLLSREEALNAEEKRLEELREAAERDHAALETDRTALHDERRTLAEHEENILAREADADAGFLERREQTLRPLRDAIDALRKRHIDEALAQDQQLNQRRQEIEQILKSRTGDLQTAEEDARGDKRQLERERWNAREAAKDAEDLKAHVEEYIETRTSERVAHTEGLLAASSRDAKALRSRIAELERLLAEREAAVRTLENMSPEAIKARLEKLQSRVRQLEDDLADRPSKAEAEELRALREQDAAREQTLQTLLVEKGRLEARLGRLQIEVDSVEILRDRNVALNENQRLLKGAINQVRTDIDQLLDKSGDHPTFPELLRMDDDPELAKEPIRFFPGSEDLKLDEFTADLQHRMGLDSNGERPKLYYRLEDVRAFLGGLAMSRLHVVQGISGIGKSSLPRAFADAVGGFCDTVSVQAGWRDRNDLFGYFNAFERRYYELPFPQTVYKAQTPQWRDRVVVVLLDEMNLSHPEQYAADLLDVLERQEASTRKFELVSFAPPGNPPALLVDGRFLRLPDNVWFVGTANHDETTKDFADKTYDRSFVLELPGRPVPFQLTKQTRRPPVSYTALTEAFKRAATLHSKVAGKALAWMEEHLRLPMGDRFQVGWGGRLESQIYRFVPVVVAAGGGLGEALDQIVTTRVLRKIKGRHDNVEEDLEHLIGILDKTWPDKAHGPTGARELIAYELRHLRG